MINYDYTEVLITDYTKKDITFLLSYSDGTAAGFMEFMPHAERSKFHSMKQVKSESDEYESLIFPLHNSLLPSPLKLNENLVHRLISYSLLNKCFIPSFISSLLMKAAI